MPDPGCTVTAPDVQTGNTHKMPTATGEKLQNGSEIGEDQQSKKTALLNVDEDGQSKDFFWDQAVKLFASGMLALTLLEVLSSISGEAVQCLTPDNYTRDQGAFINAYCTQFTQRTDFFLFLLIAQAILVYGPHFLWSSVFYGKFRYFTALALSLDRHRNSKTGEFDLKNFVTVRALTGTFSSTYQIYVTYLVKLFLQLVIAGVFIGVCATLFSEYNPAFNCPTNDSLHLISISWPLDEQIVCVLSSLNLLFAVWWTNFVLLGGTVVVSVCGLVWCALNHQTKLNWRQVAEFTLQSGIQPSYYHPKSWQDRWFSKYALRYRIRSNLDFLVLRLYRDDAGRAQVLREVLIAQLISEQEQRLQERLGFLREVKDEQTCIDLLNMIEKKRIRERQAKLCNCKLKRAQPDQDLGNTLDSVLCNFLTNKTMNLPHIYAVDISFGASGFKMLIAARNDCHKVVSVNFDPYYLNAEKSYVESSFLSQVFSFKTWSTIFSKEKEVINELKNEIAKHFFTVEQRGEKDVHSLLNDNVIPGKRRINVVLVGPIPMEESQHIITVHWMLMMLIKHKLVRETFYLIVIRPLAVEGQPVEFKEFEPVWVDGEEGSGENKLVQFHECAYLRHDPDSSQREASTAKPRKVVIGFGPWPWTGDSAAADSEHKARVSERKAVVIGYSSERRHVNCFGEDGPPDSLRKGIVVECGSTHCKFDIKVYKGDLPAAQD